MTTNECPFCGYSPSSIILTNDEAYAIYDTKPLSPGHLLILPKRHIASLFEATVDEQTAMLLLLDQARGKVMREFHPDGFNIGINDGFDAGQTVMHLHIHLIPRYKGDVPNPRGGVRWIIPDKAAE